MWPISQLMELGVEFDARRNSFTYTFPPPYLGKLRGTTRRPVTFAEGKIDAEVTLYLHIPFCEMDCAFCSLHRTAYYDDDLIGRYLTALKNEILLLQPYMRDGRLFSVYIGGGTPTILAPSEVNELLDVVDSVFPASEKAIEVNMECAPSPRRSRAQWREYFGDLVNRTRLPLTRLSFGVQSPDSTSLRDMRRPGGQSAVLALLQAIDECTENYNVDFILNYPGSADLLSSDEWCVQLLDWIDVNRNDYLRLPSISLYQLWDATALPVTKEKGRRLLDEKALLKRKWALHESLNVRGYKPGIISTLVQAKRFTSQWFKRRHLKVYQIGCGSGSYSIFPNEFVQRERDIGGYIDACGRGRIYEETSISYVLSPEEAEVRRLIMGLRSYEWIPRTSCDTSAANGIVSEVQAKILQLVQLGLIVIRDDMMRFDDAAFFIGNELSSYLHPLQYARRSDKQ